MATQTEINTSESVESVETYEFDEPIRGYPELEWKGKRPFRSTQYYPAQLKETYGEEVDGWTNKIYWGDNLQVMSHLLKTYRGKIDLIYIDPPFDSKADYKKKIELKGKKVESDRTAFEEKQYTDIWTNDEYLQFMYERLILMRELLSDKGSIYLHCDPNMSHYLKLIMDNVFGQSRFRNELIWGYKASNSPITNMFPRKHDVLLFYSGTDAVFNPQYTPYSEERIDTAYRYRDEDGRLYRKHSKRADGSERRIYLDEAKGVPVLSWWTDVIGFGTATQSKERLGYPTQKPEALLERIIKASSDPGDLVFDCFMGSGTTQAVAMKLGRRFIGADINLGAVETTTKRLTHLSAEIHEENTYRLSSGGGGGGRTFCLYRL